MRYGAIWYGPVLDRPIDPRHPAFPQADGWTVTGIRSYGSTEQVDLRRQDGGGMMSQPMTDFLRFFRPVVIEV